MLSSCAGSCFSRVLFFAIALRYRTFFLGAGALVDPWHLTCVSHVPLHVASRRPDVTVAEDQYVNVHVAVIVSPSIALWSFFRVRTTGKPRLRIRGCDIRSTECILRKLCALRFSSIWSRAAKWESRHHVDHVTFKRAVSWFLLKVKRNFVTANAFLFY